MKKRVLSVSLDEEIIEWLDGRADAENRSRSNVLQNLAKDAMEAEKACASET